MKLSVSNKTAATTAEIVLLLLLAGTTGLAGPKEYTVAADGSGDFRTLQAAVAAVPDDNPNRIVFHIRPGVYQGQIVLPASKPNVTFAGDDVEKVVLTYALNIHEPPPAGVSPKYAGIGVVILGDDFHAENITFQNTSGDHGQALALRADGDRAVFNHCRLLGWQDTLRVDDGRDYFTNCYIAGRVDFIYGSGTAVFDHCEIHSRNGGHVTAANTPQDQPYGFVFLDCRLTGDSQPWINPGGLPVNPNAHPLADLGRPWRPYASVAYLNCWMGDHIKPEGWDNWGKASNETTARYAEYHSTGPGANPAARVKWAHQLTDQQASAYNVANILHGDDGWDPTQDARIPEANVTAPSTQPAEAERNRRLPTLFIVGDSTVHNRAPGLLGWGDVIGRYFDTHKLIVENDAKPGRSSRTFQTQGWWAQILAAARPGDFVLIQMGDNDGGPLDDTNRARGSIPGIGDQSQEIYNPVLHQPEVVHTYGWYMRKYVDDARAKGMVPLICSPVPRLPRHTVEAGDVDKTSYVEWSAEVARQEHVFFIPLNHLVLMHYVGMTPQEIKAKYFTTHDNTHASPAGAALNASAVIEGLRALKDCSLNDYLRNPPGVSGSTTAR
jgi:pectinesterase